MHNSAQRFVLAALLLVGLWIVTYWAWPAPSVADEAGITFDDTTSPVAQRPQTPAPEPAIATAQDLSSAAEPTRAPPPPVVSDPAPPVRNAATTGPAVVPPEFRTYVVQEHDNPWRIAERIYGDTRHWSAIAKANPLVDVNKLRAGQTLRIPVDPGNIQGLPVAPAAPTVAAGRVPEPDVTEYTVTKNDTLSGIAKRFYGSSADWRVIFDANRSVISTPEDIRPGMKLRIPPAPSGARR